MLENTIDMDEQTRKNQKDILTQAAVLYFSGLHDSMTMLPNGTDTLKTLNNSPKLREFTMKTLLANK